MKCAAERKSQRRRRSTKRVFLIDLGLPHINFIHNKTDHLNSARGSSLLELSDGLGALGDGVLGKFSGKDELEGRLDLTAGESPPSVVSDKLGGLDGDGVEGVVHEGVHDVHGSLGDADLGVHLLEDLVDVESETLVSLLGSPGGGASALLCGLSGGHVE